MKLLYVYLICLFIVPFVPNSFSIDVIGVHWFLLSIINLSFILFFFLSKRTFTVSFLFKFKPYTALFSFIIFCLFSLFFARNFNLSIIDFSRVFNIFLSVILLSNLLNEKADYLIISFIITFFLIADVFTTFLPYISLSQKSSNTFLAILTNNFSPTYLKGFTGNKNINAAFILIKVPFLLYSISYSKKRIIKFFLYLLLFLTTVTLFLIQSRAAYLSLSIVSLLYISYSFLYKRNNLFVLPVLFLSFLLSNFILTSSKSSSIINEVQSIQFNDASSQGRLTLWENALDASIQNNFIGLGIGSWKIESLPYWNKNGTDYMVPYHAHNDFLELLAEIGLLGAVSYFLVFIFSFYLILQSFLRTKSLIDVTLLSALVVYFIDACLNFPLERYTMQFIFAILMLLIFNRYGKKKIIL